MSGFLATMGVYSIANANKSNIEPFTSNVTMTQNSQFKTFFLSKETRVKIDLQREAYLNPPEVKEIVKILPKSTGTLKPKKKRIYIPPKVSVSLVMVKPDGSRLVRVNKKYNRSPSKHISMDFSNSSPNGVPVSIQGKNNIVPVGSTLLTRKNKLVKTYKLKKVKRKKPIPKTKQDVIKNTLEQVQILKPR